ncbi:MAG: YgjV family protein [Pseudomonadales bacterium]|nr:YgjV family protein [Pseudomonadales bacterium]
MEVASIFGFLGVLANAIWPLIKKRKWLLFGQVVACALMFTHFLLLGALTGATVMFVAGLQASLAIPLEDNSKFKNIYLFSFLFTPLVCFYTWHGYASVFSSLALAIFCLGNLQTDMKKLRTILLFCIFAWVGHNIIVSSIPGLLSNFIAGITSIFALYREFKPNKLLQSGSSNRHFFCKKRKNKRQFNSPLSSRYL